MKVGPESKPSVEEIPPSEFIYVEPKRKNTFIIYNNLYCRIYPIKNLNQKLQGKGF